MSFKNFLLEFDEEKKRFHDFFQDLRRNRFGAVYFGKHGWFDLYLMLETQKEFKDFHSSPGKITEAYPEGLYAKVAEACVKISNTAQKAGMRKQKGTMFIQFPQEGEGGMAYPDYRITILSKLALKKSDKSILETVAHEWAHTILYNLPMHVKKQFNDLVLVHRIRLSKIYQIPLKNIPSSLEQFDNVSKEIEEAMKEYVKQNHLPWEYCLLNGEEMWAVCIEDMVTGKALNPTLRKMVINSL